MFQPGDAPMTLYDTDLRLGPGTNYNKLVSVPAYNQVTIEQHGNGLDGIQAKGTYWWYVTYNGMSGWVPESNLILTSRLNNIYPRPEFSTKP
jgi:uncharacterized protein YraI